MKSRIKNHIYVPNEIFKDLRDNLKSSKHNAFTYSYYYYATYLYRYCEYYRNEKITQAMMKEKLQKSPIDKNVDYIIKNNGVLDTMGYTRTTSDYPLSWTIDSGFLEFETISDRKSELGYKTIIQDLNYKVKYPVKSFFRNPDSEIEGLLDGTFYEVANTHKIYYDVFDKCMSEKDLGTNAFYIYGYIKHKQGTLNTYRMASRNVKEELIMSDPTFRRYTDALEQHGLIKIYRVKFSGKNGEANGYSIIE